MQFIHPISEDTIRPHMGKRVCAVLCNGTYYYGVVTDVRDGHLVLGGKSPQTATCRSKITKPETKSKAVTISQFFPGALALSLGTLAFLFLI
ncbi:hypothetical protein [Paenibacillus azoreducens]|uniref:Uncharacterized protein n=1 Tax=Paenibacillus azoreducens TaxID=116718 RepID=A0A919YJ22_9BACL|nr:hypothetical protein [Paenibacillus azoreducens]GIO50468.1 hypothetical protein J34TS1_52330 [Paenibacillus azoreducens]